MSNQRGLVSRIERKLENTVGDAVARVFGGSIVPQEVEELLRREAADGVQTLQGGRFLAPNDYVITLSGSDFEKVSADRDLTSDTFAKHLGGYIQEQGWQTYGDVVVRFEHSPNLHTGQYRARGVVNPDASPHPTAGATAPAESKDAFTAEPGVPPMSDNPSYRGDQGQGRPADDYYEDRDRYARPADEPRGGTPAPEQRGPYPPDQERPGYTPPNEPGYPPRGGYPEQGGYQQGYPSQGGYEQRPPAGYGGGYDQGYRQPPPGYGPPPQAPYGPPAGGGYNAPSGDYDYGRAPGRHEEPGYGRPESRPGYPDQGGYEQQQGYPGQGGGYGRQDYAQPDYPRYEQGAGYAEPGRDYDYGQPAGGGYAGYGQPAQGDYPGAAHNVTLQLDDGSGRTYQLREGANVIGRGQDAQFRLPDTGVSRRHLEIRWDGQVALLSDLNSTNGTTVNNAPVQEWQLADGDVIRLGHSEIIVRVH
ncbi:DUF3662 domain-containing protein [Mycobacterium sp. NBC_00419]|uniref:DUF3662 and FHA domain-containing protein n=1 Tax=Mycobacterium sp. NBC_00419 TaxID=2975989 RepID=UPI002E1E09DB